MHDEEQPVQKNERGVPQVHGHACVKEHSGQEGGILTKVNGVTGYQGCRCEASATT